MGVTKRTKEIEYAEVTLASDKSKQYLLNTLILFANERLFISLPFSHRTSNPNFPHPLTTSVIVKGLPVSRAQQESRPLYTSLLAQATSTMSPTTKQKGTT